MASVIDICNLALANLGHSKTVTAITPPDGSREAALCARFYPIVRDQVLEMNEWGFATKRQTLASLGTPPTGWDYRYALPSDIVKPLRIFEYETEVAQPFVIESDATGTVVLTNVIDAELHYTARVENTTKYSPSFVETLGWGLASRLAGPLTGDLKLGEYCMQRAVFYAGQAVTNDANIHRLNTRAKLRQRYPIGTTRGSSVNLDS